MTSQTTKVGAYDGVLVRVDEEDQAYTDLLVTEFRSPLEREDELAVLVSEISVIYVSFLALNPDGFEAFCRKYGYVFANTDQYTARLYGDATMADFSIRVESCLNAAREGERSDSLKLRKALETEAQHRLMTAGFDVMRSIYREYAETLRDHRLFELSDDVEIQYYIDLIASTE